MTRTVEVSVVIPCRNAAEHIGELFDSLAQQDFQGHWEVVVADNGSTDESLAIARRYSHQIPLRTCEAHGKASSAAARKTGVLEATGGKLLFVDADDALAPGYVRHMCAALDIHDCVAGRIDAETLNPGWLRSAHGDPWQTDDVWVAYRFLPSAGPAVGVRRELYDQVGGHDEAFSTAYDIALSWAIQLSGRQIGFVKEAIYRYRFRSTWRGLFRQTLEWGREDVHLYTRFRAAGMPGRLRQESIGEWLTVGRLLLRAGERRARPELAVALGACVGRLAGSLRYRVMYL